MLLTSKSSLLLLFSAGMMASAGAFTELIVFGDSLADNGNLFNFTGFGLQRQSNGPLFVEYAQLALTGTEIEQALHLNLFRDLPPNPAGKNFAVTLAAAFTEEGDDFAFADLPFQVQGFAAFQDLGFISGPFGDETLFVVEIGGNDIFDARNIVGNVGRNDTVTREQTKSSKQSKSAKSAKGSKSAKDPKSAKSVGKKLIRELKSSEGYGKKSYEEACEEYDALVELANKRIEDGVAALVEQIRNLIALGATNMIILDSPSFENSPSTRIQVEFFEETAETKLQKKIAKEFLQLNVDLPNYFNSLLRAEVESLMVEFAGQVTFFTFDTIPFLQGVLDSGVFANTEDPCLLTLADNGFDFRDPAPEFNDDPVCDLATAPTFFWWDENHPTTGVHLTFACAMLQTVGLTPALCPQ